MKLEKRRVGNTNLELTVLGLGTASLAGSMEEVKTSDAVALIPHALDAGINYVDTAPFYGFGRSEHLVGDAIRDRRDEIILSTKVGRLLAPQFGPYERPNGWKNPYPFVDVFDYSHDGIMRSFEDSLQRLGLNRIDILLVHDIDPGTHGKQASAAHMQTLKKSGYRALSELKSSGAISAIGLGVNEWPVVMEAFEIGDWDVCLLAGRYTLLEQASLSPFLETCVERNTSIVIGGPFNSGVLVGGTSFDYAQAPREVFEAVAKIQTVCDRFDVELPAAALQFPLAHPAVVSTIPGPRTVAEMDQILAWWQVDIPPDFWLAMQEAGCIDKNAPCPGKSA
ncbi:MAG TPA: aldo/keto reductase [Devosia sp.]|nr:aldo/keto reductase [Devosia sp.]